MGLLAFDRMFLLVAFHLTDATCPTPWPYLSANRFNNAQSQGLSQGISGVWIPTGLRTCLALLVHLLGADRDNRPDPIWC